MSVAAKLFPRIAHGLFCQFGEEYADKPAPHPALIQPCRRIAIAEAINQLLNRFAVAMPLGHTLYDHH